MTIKSTITKLLRFIDLFPNSQLLRYKGDPEYTTATGGFVSLSVIVILIILFASMGFRTINRKIITSSTSTSYSSNPSSLSFKTSP